ncbi:MAG: DUF1947 domain-containing protein [Candidatus Bathyarchaeia archaeon]|nr:DUF1947 domain-containing protein [Candidatus Bathyarchaeota archaeon]
MSISRRTLSHKEVKVLASQLSSFKDYLNLEGGRVSVEVARSNGVDIFFIGRVPLLFKSGGIIAPTLLFESYLSSLGRIVVDMGAVAHVCNGANIMAPGVKSVHGIFQDGSFVTVVDEKYGKTLAVGRALYSSESMVNISRGVVVENIHYVGDKIYRIYKSA